MPVPVGFIDQNPWWRNPLSIEEDRHIAIWKNSRVPSDPRVRYRFKWDRDAIYTLRGPRQVGKTTLLKQMIRDLLSKVDSKRVFYHTCDLVDNPKNLTDVVAGYVDAVRVDTKERLFIFLDEISSIRDWQRGIKHLVDVGKMQNTTAILTGSHTIDIKRAIEKLPGRRGEVDDAIDKILIPMKFSEYVETLSPELAKVIQRLGLLVRNLKIVIAPRHCEWTDSSTARRDLPLRKGAGNPLRRLPSDGRGSQSH